MSKPDIQVQGTPNPNAAKFVLDRAVTEGESRSYFDPESAEDDPLARRLFQVEGVRALLLADDFVTVTKSPDREWEELVPGVRKALETELD